MIKVLNYGLSHQFVFSILLPCLFSIILGHICLGLDDLGGRFGLYFVKRYYENGTSCMFVHGENEANLLDLSTQSAHTHVGIHIPVNSPPIGDQHHCKKSYIHPWGSSLVVETGSLLLLQILQLSKNEKAIQEKQKTKMIIL